MNEFYEYPESGIRKILQKLVSEVSQINSAKFKKIWN
jgi:hypothetical protein